MGCGFRYDSCDTPHPILIKEVEGTTTACVTVCLSPGWPAWTGQYATLCLSSALSYCAGGAWGLTEVLRRRHSHRLIKSLLHGLWALLTSILPSLARQS